MASIPAGSIHRAAEMIKHARHLVALTGAGISVPSGVPDFRSAGSGLWEKDDPMQVASLSTFRRRPERFFDWLRPLAEQIRASNPNPAHLALARLEKAGHLQAVITQNIDGLHQRAGSQTVIELHGSAQSMTCHTCRKNFPASDFHKQFIVERSIPRCPKCGQVVKPDIILFEEMLPVDAWEEAMFNALHADVMLVVGSSLTVSPAGNLPFYTLSKGGQLIINTLSSTPLDDQAALLLPGDVAEVLPGILEAL